MAFRVTPVPTFSIEVKVNIANEKGGFDVNSFIAKFKRPTTEETKLLRDLDNDELVRQQLIGWELIDKESNESVPFTQSALEAVLSIPPTPQATALAFWEGCGGARRKN